jgi:hypothetical protein
MRAIKINPTLQSVEQIDYTHKDHTSILAEVDADILTCTLLNSSDTLYHGLNHATIIKELRPSFWVRRIGAHFGRAYFRIDGNGLIVSHDEEGRPCDTTMTLEQVQELVTFSEPIQVVAQAH